jgi:hypothetical protein
VKPAGALNGLKEKIRLGSFQPSVGQYRRSAAFLGMKLTTLASEPRSLLVYRGGST